jgi:hypothetical protein
MSSWNLVVSGCKHSIYAAAVVAAACAERLFPVYEAFRAETGWDTNGELRVVLDFIWEVIAADGKPLLTLKDRIFELTPDGAECDSLLTTASQDVCIFLNCAVGLCLGDVKDLNFLPFVIEAQASLMPATEGAAIVIIVRLRWQGCLSTVSDSPQGPSRPIVILAPVARK